MISDNEIQSIEEDVSSVLETAYNKAKEKNKTTIKLKSNDRY